MWHKRVACWLVAIVSGTAAWAETIRVPEDFPTIQAAIDSAVNGDEIVVGPGTYAEIVDFLGKAISVSSSDGADVTTINGGSPYNVIFDSFEGPEAILDGFTVTSSAGSAVLLEFSDPTIRNCVFDRNRNHAIRARSTTATVTNCDFRDNVGKSAVYATTSSAVFTDCDFIGNSSVTDGGAVHIESFCNMFFVGCTFDSNDAPAGGAISNTGSSNTRVVGCLFSNNSVQTRGGAVLISDNEAMFEDCIFIGNSAPDGGAIFMSKDAIFTGCRFDGNLASHDGGAIYSPYFQTGNLTLGACEFIGNRADDYGGAVFTYGKATIANCTFEQNLATFGSGLVVGIPSSTITNCMFRGNFSGVSGGVYNYGKPQITGCTFDRNDAASLGGAFFNYGSSADPYIADCTFSNNTAFAGAGIFSRDNGATATVSSSLFCGNSPDHIGGDWTDNGGNEFLVKCEATDDCPADIDQNDAVDFNDILAVLDGWGPVADCPPFIRADIDQDCEVGFNDLVLVLSNWGPCP